MFCMRGNLYFGDGSRKLLIHVNKIVICISNRESSSNQNDEKLGKSIQK